MSERDTTEWPHELALDDEPGPAAWLPRAQADDLVLGALDQAGFVANERISGIGRRSQPGKPGIGMRSLAAAAVLACLSIGSASAAVMYFGRRKEAPAVERARPQPEKRRVHAPVVAPPPQAPLAVEPEVVSEAPAVKEHRRAPEDWLEEGNRLRTAQRWGKADDAYARAAQNAPHSQTAYVAEVAAAGVRLEHLHDPRGALARYRSALKQRPGGALAEEIDWGIAEAYRALGDRAAERSALERFVREHPRSPLLAQAKARLD